MVCRCGWSSASYWVRKSIYHVAIDYGTRFCVAQCMEAATTQTLIKFLDEHILRFGLPWQIIMDWGAIMMARKTGWYVKKDGIQHSPTIAYYSTSEWACGENGANVKNDAAPTISKSRLKSLGFTSSTLCACIQHGLAGNGARYTIPPNAWIHPMQHHYYNIYGPTLHMLNAMGHVDYIAKKQKLAANYIKMGKSTKTELSLNTWGCHPAGWGPIMMEDRSPMWGLTVKLQPPFKGPYIITELDKQNNCIPIGVRHLNWYIYHVLVWFYIWSFLFMF